MEHIYSQIADKLDEIIPEEWTKIYAYAEIIEDAKEAYFFYCPKDKKEFVYSHFIPQMTNMSQHDYFKFLEQLLDCFKELQDEFRKSGQDVWTNLTFIIESTGKFKIDYDYTDLSEASDYKRQIIWNYKYLGLEPEDEDDKEILKEYLNTKERK